MKRLLVFIYLALYNTILFAQILPSPGGVGQSNLTAWFKATDLANGNVTSWSTAYPTGGSAITVTEAGAPYPVATNTPTGNTSNYNTTIYFDTTNLSNNIATDLRGLINTTSLDLLDNKGNGDEGTFFGSYHYPKYYDINDHMMEYNEASNGSDFDGIQFRQLNSYGRLAIGHVGNSGSSNATRHWNRSFYPEIVSYRGNRSTSTSMDSYKDSKLYTAASTSQCGGTQGLSFGYKRGAANSQYKGFLNEFIFFNRDLTDSEMLRVDSYLAVKYGITLDNSGGGTQGDYYGSDNNIVWDASLGNTYHNDVIGISGDSASGLFQRQSHTFDDTTRIYRNTLLASNEPTNNTFTDEISYIMIGHNKGNMYADINSNAEMPAMCGANALHSRIGREWKVTRTDAAQPFSIDLTLNTNANLTNVNPADLRLLVDDDGDFSNGGTICYATGNFSLSITYNNPILSIENIRKEIIPNDETRYITIASIDALTPLPIELVSFDVNCEDGMMVSEWVTETEINNDYFTIERSIDGLSFEQIARINGSGNSSTQKTYSWIDDHVSNEIVYYRLKQIDFNGEFKYLGIKAADCSESNSFNIYPNPFENSFTIELSEKITFPITLEVIDFLGRKVQTQIIETNVTEIVLDEQFRTGTYFVKIASQTTQMIERIVKTN